MLRVAIIDDGINSNWVKNVKKAYMVDKKGCIRSKKIDYGMTHATICAYLIKQISEDVEFIDLQILNSNGEGYIAQLVAGLELCLKESVDIVNMSLCTCSYHDYKLLSPVIRRVIQNKRIILSSYHNENIISFPAFIEGVIGVYSKKTLALNHGEFVISRCKDKIDVCIGFEEGDYLIGNEKIKLSSTNSYATALLTGIVCKYLSHGNNKNYQEIITMLENNSKDICELGSCSLRAYYNSKNAKEMQTPTICFHKIDREVMHILLQQLCNEGYRYEIFSENDDIDGAIPLCWYCGKNEKISKEIFIFLESIYQADIFVLYNISDILDCRNSFQYIDIYIYCCKSKFTIWGNNYKKENVVLEQVWNNVFGYFV